MREIAETERGRQNDVLGRADILTALRETVAGNYEHTWTGEDGLFARAAAEIESLRRDYAILLERWREADARIAELESRPLLNAETVMSGRMNQVGVDDADPN